MGRDRPRLIVTYCIAADALTSKYEHLPCLPHQLKPMSRGLEIPPIRLPLHVLVPKVIAGLDLVGKWGSPSHW